MLRRVLDAGIDADVRVCFANTGKECAATLDFVHECETRWQVPIVWLEYFREVLPKYRSEDRRIAAENARSVYTTRTYRPSGESEPRFRIVSYETASRNGEPFDNLIETVGLPSPTTRLCTQEMKIRPMKRYMQREGYTFWNNVVGIRADEPRRVAKMRAAHAEPWNNILPLAEADITKADVVKFWKMQPFDLQLPLDADNETYEGNCDMCFLKSTAKRVRIAKEHPERLVWWMAQEARTGMTFLPNSKPFNALPGLSIEQCAVDDDLGDCICHD